MMEMTAEYGHRNFESISISPNMGLFLLVKAKFLKAEQP